MPYGLANAPAVFQSFINEIFRDILNKYVVAYIDDILIYSKSEEEHKGHTQDPGVPASVPRTTADVTSPAESCSIVSTAPSGALLQASSAVRLHRLWSETLPPEDHKWIASRLFKMGPKGKPKLLDVLQLWDYPPQPAPTYNQAPAPDRFFCHALLLWMPYKLWMVKVLCPNPACGLHQLTGGGLHKRARQVLDIDRMYNMVTETLICIKCKASHVFWNQTVLQQLDLGHRVILTRK
ncbi:uncharacterized protein LOC125244504 [Megalobrama amblycephala]|uniref:uncharacterized protein LOC125244504 n=1 Tax=Megalobrama amblycephala TaxID=75352 RepID=UPI00201432D5|nr:uncharacterized protein LOC125244504 [Megalobrama amblycephala]